MCHLVCRHRPGTHALLRGARCLAVLGLSWSLSAGAAAPPREVSPSTVETEGEAVTEAQNPSPPETGVRAQEPTEPAVAELSPQELAEIEKALAVDAKPKEAASAMPSGVAAALQSFNPDLALIVDVAAGWFSGGTALAPGGHDPAKTGFTLQQLELAASQAVDPYFRFDAALVFSQFGVEVEEAYATTLDLPWSLQARVGQFLTRFGRQNNTHPHSWDFVDQAFPIARVFGGEGNRGLGAEVSWLAPLPWHTELVLSATDAAGESTARSFFGGQGLPLESPLDLQTTLALKQFFDLSDDWSLLVGLSGANGPNPTGHDNRTDVFGLDLYLRFRPVTEGSYTAVSLQGEVFWRRRQIPNDLAQDVSAYGQISWRFARRWGAAARYEWGGPSRLRNGEVGGDLLDPHWTTARQRLSASLTFWPTEFSRLRAQLGRDDAGWSEKAVWSGLLAVEFSVGAPGAHAV